MTRALRLVPTLRRGATASVLSILAALPVWAQRAPLEAEEGRSEAPTGSGR